jgi:menaquinol-cytochrome c reductase cytochrome b/c subunit
MEMKEPLRPLRKGAPRARSAAAVAAVERREERVHTWPHLVSVELMAALIFLVLLSLMSVVVKAPLGSLANPEVTPDPAKAPWYFLGLQELLLHMNPSLAGVIVPTVVLVGLAALPYIDRRRKGTGIWFSGPKGKAITAFAAFYTAVWELALIFLDEWLPVPGSEARGVAPYLEYLLRPLDLPPVLIDVLGGWLVPIFFMTFIPFSLAVIVRRHWKADTREVAIALYTFFVASFVVLTIIGTAFRGYGMQLMWPWEIGRPIGF